MKYALKCGYVSANPCKEISTVKTDKKEKDIYSLEELQVILRKINQKASTDYKVFFHLLAYCGLRRGEALGIEYKDIDFEKNTVSIVRTSNYSVEKGVYTDTPKTKSSCRQLQLQPFIVEMIKNLRKEQKVIAGTPLLLKSSATFMASTSWPSSSWPWSSSSRSSS